MQEAGCLASDPSMNVAQLSQIQQWQGQVVSVFGISPWAFSNNALVGTGSVTVPYPY